MQAEKMVLHTDTEGRIIDQPLLPPNATLEAIYLVTAHRGASAPELSKASPAEIARRLAADGVGAVFGDPLEWQRREREDRPWPSDKTGTA